MQNILAKMRESKIICEMLLNLDFQYARHFFRFHTGNVIIDCLKTLDKAYRYRDNKEI